MLRRTPLKAKKVSLKKTALRKGNHVLKKQSDEAKEKWEEARKKALIRDNHKCIVCGKPATQVHHIHLRSQRKDLLYELNNLVSLCDIHHFHSAYELYKEQTVLIAKAKDISVEELLKLAEIKSKE